MRPEPARTGVATVVPVLVVLAVMALAPPLATAQQGDDPANRAFAFNEVGEFEEEPSFSYGFVPNHHVQSQVLANESGQILLLTIANFGLYGQRSTDGGSTYGTPFAIETARPVIGFQAHRSEDERVYVAYRFAGLTKDIGLRFRRSDDMGLSWTSPVDLVGEGDPQHGVGTIWNIHANESGRVAVAFAEYWEATDTYVTVSSNFGATWTTPVKPDLDTVANRVPLECKVLVDQAGTVHVPYVQNRGSGSRVYYSRSTDGGASFGGELAVGSVSGASTQTGLDADVTRQGRIVIAVGDAGTGGTLRIWQSANAGASFTQTAVWANLGQPVARATRVAPSYSTDTVLVGYLADFGAIYTIRSADEGATFGTPANRSLGGTRDYALGRTNDGTWVLVHERSPFVGEPSAKNILQAVASFDDGWVFGSPVQVDHNGGADQAESRLAGMQTTNGLSGIIIAYRDFRTGANWETYANRATSSSFTFSSELVVGPYGNVGNRIHVAGVLSAAPIALASTPTTVHLMYGMIEAGNSVDVYHARSTNSGDTYNTPVRLGQHAVGTETILHWALAVHPTDPQRLYAVYARKKLSPLQVDLLMRRSTNGGTSWLPEQLVTSLAGIDPTAVRLAVNRADDLFAIYSTGSDLRMVISRDDGATWGTAFDFDQQISGPTLINDLPVACASGSVVAVVWRSNQTNFAYQTIVARVSNDSGLTFPSAVNLRPGQVTSANVPDVECTGNEAFAVWADFRDTSLTRAWGNRYTAGAWQSERQVAPTQTRNQFVPRVIYTLNGATPTPLVTYTDNAQVFTNRSLDGGATWQPPVRLDDLAPQPIASSLRPYLVSDGGGNTWVVWQDASAGQASIAARRSFDGGSTWEGLVVRLDSDPNQGSKFNQWPNGLEVPVAASGGTMHAVWAGQRYGGFFDVRAARWGVGDADGDGVGAAVDCNNADPTIGAAPVEVAGVRVERVTGTARVSWASQDATAGSSTSYDIVSGDLAALRSSGGFSGATCLVNNDADTPYDDTRGAPPPGAGDYFLVRAQHACVGTYGNARTTPDPRDALDAGGGCP